MGLSNSFLDLLRLHEKLNEMFFCYPWLDRIATEVERSSLVKQCRGSKELEKRDQPFFANHGSYF